HLILIKVTMVRITYSQETLARISSGKKPLNETVNNVTVDLELAPIEAKFTHTIILYDLDAPYPEDPTNAPFLHWIVSNIRGNDVNTGRVIFPYFPPQPPSNSKPHRYILQVFRQEYPLEFAYQDYPRQNFPLYEFIEA